MGTAWSYSPFQGGEEDSSFLEGGGTIERIEARLDQLKRLAAIEAVQATQGLSISDEDRLRIAEASLEDTEDWRDVPRSDNPVFELQQLESSFGSTKIIRNMKRIAVDSIVRTNNARNLSMITQQVPQLSLQTSPQRVSTLRTLATAPIVSRKIPILKSPKRSPVKSPVRTAVKSPISSPVRTGIRSSPQNPVVQELIQRSIQVTEESPLPENDLANIVTSPANVTSPVASPIRLISSPPQIVRNPVESEMQMLEDIEENAIASVDSEEDLGSALGSNTQGAIAFLVGILTFPFFLI